MTLRALRIEKQLSQAKVAQALGVSMMTYSGWERHRNSPTPENLSKLIEFFGIPPSDIVAQPVGRPIR